MRHSDEVEQTNTKITLVMQELSKVNDTIFEQSFRIQDVHDKLPVQDYRRKPEESDPETEPQHEQLEQPEYPYPPGFVRMLAQ